MTIFWILAAGLAGMALLFVLAPLLGRGPAAEQADDIDLDEVNLSLYKQQVAELDADLAAGKLDQDQYDSARQDLEREALNNIGSPEVGNATDSGAQATKPGVVLPSARLTAVALLMAVPAATLALYLMLGSQEMIPRLDTSAAGQVATPQGHGGDADGMPPLDVLVAQLEQRMQQNPDDAEGWVMLGRTYFAMRDAAKAESALAKAYALTPNDIQVLLAYAEAVAANNGNSLEGRPSELIAEALQVDPNDVTARWLSGMVAFQRGQFSAATIAWKAVLGQIDPNSDDAAELRQLIATAEQRAGIPTDARLAAQSPAAASTTGLTAATDGPAAPAATTSGPNNEPETEPQTTNQPQASAAAIDVQVSLAPELAQRASPGTTVFVYAKAAAGPPMPLAVQRITVADLPASLRLDDSMAMMPAMKLSSFPQVIVGARISPSGQAMPQPGDLEGETGPISSANSPQVAITIDRERP